VEVGADVYVGVYVDVDVDVGVYVDIDVCDVLMCMCV